MLKVNPFTKSNAAIADRYDAGKAPPKSRSIVSQVLLSIVLLVVLLALPPVLSDFQINLLGQAF